ncbi:hypothetical protein B566_EDAN009452 [Ephemera danica]|nr:hypothetical protein B566_EDAN009452 [Ephemera danica]
MIHWRLVVISALIATVCMGLAEKVESELQTQNNQQVDETQLRTRRAIVDACADSTFLQVETCCSLPTLIPEEAITSEQCKSQKKVLRPVVNVAKKRRKKRPLSKKVATSEPVTSSETPPQPQQVSEAQQFSPPGRRLRKRPISFSRRKRQENPTDVTVAVKKRRPSILKIPCTADCVLRSLNLVNEITGDLDLDKVKSKLSAGQSATKVEMIRSAVDKCNVDYQMYGTRETKTKCKRGLMEMANCIRKNLAEVTIQF